MDFTCTGVGNVPMIIESQNGTINADGPTTLSGPQYIPTAVLDLNPAIHYVLQTIRATLLIMHLL